MYQEKSLQTFLRGDSLQIFFITLSLIHTVLKCFIKINKIYCLKTDYIDKKFRYKSIQVE